MTYSLHVDVLTKDDRFILKIEVQPVNEPGSPAWQRTTLPLSQRLKLE